MGKRMFLIGQSINGGFSIDLFDCRRVVMQNST